MGDCQSKPVIVCRNCDKKYPTTQIQTHKCHSINPSQIALKMQYPELFDQFKTRKGSTIEDNEEQIKVKEPYDETFTKFEWIKRPNFVVEPQISESPPSFMKRRDFIQKLQWFYINVGKLSDSKQGVEIIKIDKQNLIDSTIKGLFNVDMRKELQVEMETVHGKKEESVIKEWMNLVVQQILNTQYFQECASEQRPYKIIKYIREQKEEYGLKLMKVLGLLIGKAILLKIPLNCNLNRVILRYICKNCLKLSDVHSYSAQVYYKMISLLKNQNIQEQNLAFTQTKKKQFYGAKRPYINNKKVTKENKQQYIRHCIAEECIQPYKKYMQKLIQSIYSVISPKYLKVFEPYELQMVMCGQMKIDINDWKQNTRYCGYDNDNQIIQWFWIVLESYSQRQLQNFLYYCTGSKKVPIKGFKYLSNRLGQRIMFKVRKVSFDDLDPSPRRDSKSNAFELPAYNSFEQLKERLDNIVRH